MAILSIVVRQAQFSGDKNITSQYCTYVTLTLDRCKTKTVTVKGHNPHWEQDYLFETQKTSRGLLIEVWRQDEYMHTPIGCYWLPLRLVRYSNEHRTGLWASLGRELCTENGEIIKSKHSTGHFLLYDARLEDPDDRRIDHHSVDNDVQDHYQPAISRRTIECVSNNSTPASVSIEQNDGWYQYGNCQDDYKSSSSENMRSDLDYSYSETSNQVDRRSYCESSEKSLEKETRYNHEYKPTQYFGGSSYDQAESYNEQPKGYHKRTSYEDHIEDDEQWVSDEDVEQDADEIYQNNHDYRLNEDSNYSLPHHLSRFKQAENKVCYPKESNYDYDDQYLDGDADEEDDDDDEEGYYDNSGYEYARRILPSPAVKRKLPSIPTSVNLPRKENYQNQYHYVQYDEEKLLNGCSRVPSIYVDSPTLSPCLSASKGASLDYRDPRSDDSASIYRFSANSTTAQSNQKTYSNNHCKTNTMHRYSTNTNFIHRTDGYASNEDEVDDYDDSTFRDYDYYDYEDEDKSEDNRVVDMQNDDDINNNQLTNDGGVTDYAKKLRSSFRKTTSIASENNDTSRRELFQLHGKTPSMARQSDDFAKQFEWTFNELPDDEFESFQQEQPDRALGDQKMPISSASQATKHQMGGFYNQIDSIMEEDDYEDDDRTLVSPVHSITLSPKAMNFISQDKEGRDSFDKDNAASISYRDDAAKSSPISDNASHVPEGYRSPYKKQSVSELTPTLRAEDALLNENDQNGFLSQLDGASTEPRRVSLKEENTAEMKRQIARNRWHYAYDKIIQQLNDDSSKTSRRNRMTIAK